MRPAREAKPFSSPRLTHRKWQFWTPVFGDMTQQMRTAEQNRYSTSSRVEKSDYDHRGTASFKTHLSRFWIGTVTSFQVHSEIQSFIASSRSLVVMSFRLRYELTDS